MTKLSQASKEVSASIVLKVRQDKCAFTDAVEYMQSELMCKKADFLEGVKDAHLKINDGIAVNFNPEGELLAFVVLYSASMKKYFVTAYLNTPNLKNNLHKLGFDEIYLFKTRKRANLKCEKLNSPYEKINSEICNHEAEIELLVNKRDRLYPELIDTKSIHEFFNQEGENYPDYSKFENIMPIVTLINVMMDYRYSVKISSLDVGIYDNIVNSDIIETEANDCHSINDAIKSAVLQFIDYCYKRGITFKL